MALMQAGLALLRVREAELQAGVFRIEAASARPRSLVEGLGETHALTALLPHLTEAARCEPGRVLSTSHRPFVEALEVCGNDVVGFDQREAFGTITLCFALWRQLNLMRTQPDE